MTADPPYWDPRAVERKAWLERVAHFEALLKAAPDRDAELLRLMSELAVIPAGSYESPEVFHPEADALLLAYVPEAVREVFLSRRRWYS